MIRTLFALGWVLTGAVSFANGRQLVPAQRRLWAGVAALCIFFALDTVFLFRLSLTEFGRNVLWDLGGNGLYLYRRYFQVAILSVVILVSLLAVTRLRNKMCVGWHLRLTILCCMLTGVSWGIEVVSFHYLDSLHFYPVVRAGCFALLALCVWAPWIRSLARPSSAIIKYENR